MSNEGLRARAKKLYVEWVNDGDDGRSYWEVMADFAQQIREEDCKAVCDLCKRGVLVRRTTYASGSITLWIHDSVVRADHGDCAASAMRNLAEKE